MKELLTNDYIISYEPELLEFIERTVAHAERKRKEFYKLFNCNENDIGILKASFFVNHDKFMDYIKSISGGKTPPDWATGCFYNGEIQVLVDINNPEKKMHLLAHETLHLFFVKTIYRKYNINRINWLDESFAVYLDGEPDDISVERLKKMINYLGKISSGFDMAVLADSNKVVTKEYNGYDMFNIIGKYIFKNKLGNEYLEIIKSDREKMIEIGKNILQISIDYFKEKYNL